MKPLKQSQLFLLFMAVFLDLLGFGIILPILPFLAVELGANGFQYGLITAIYSLMQFIFAPLWGNLSDRFGRRPIIIIGLGGSVVGFAIFGFATSLGIIYLSRAIAGIFTSATLTVSYAYIADVTQPSERGKYFGLIAGAFGLGFAFGPAIGGLMADVIFIGISGYQLPSFAAAFIAFLNMVAALFLLPESLTEEDKTNMDTGNKRLFPILETSKLKEFPGVLLLITIFSLSSFAFSNFIAAFPIYVPVVDPSVDPEALGLYFTFAGLILVFTQFILIRILLSKFGEENVAKIGIVLYLIGFLTLPLVNSISLMYFTNAPLMIGIGLLNPSINSLISRKAPRTQQGLVLGINQGWGSLMRVFGPLIAGTLFDINIRYPFYLATIIFTIVLIIALKRINSTLQNS